MLMQDFRCRRRSLLARMRFAIIARLDARIERKAELRYVSIQVKL
jgi:hypothetical protein